MTFDHQARVGRLQGLLAEHGVDVALLSIGADLPYFTGYEAMASERLTAMVIPADGDPVLVIPELEAPRVQSDWLEVRPWSELDDPVALAAGIGGSPARVAVGDHMWSAFLVRFQKEWTAASWTAASSLTGLLRVIKDPTEVDFLRRAAHGVDRVMGRVASEVRFEGRREIEVARDLAEMTVEEGHDLADFAIVGSGPNGASPHHHPGDRLIGTGDMVVCDFGGRLGGYYSDSTRTFVVGDPTPEQIEVHALVLAANEAGRDTAGPGVACEDVDRAARAVIDEAGHGDHFIHRTGHGIGLEVHEDPYMVEGNARPLVPGMAFSVEPGVYLPGRFGVRIEDIVVCRPDGIESLNLSDRALVSVG